MNQWRHLKGIHPALTWRPYAPHSPARLARLCAAPLGSSWERERDGSGIETLSGCACISKGGGPDWGMRGRLSGRSGAHGSRAGASWLPNSDAWLNTEDRCHSAQLPSACLSQASHW